MAGATNSIIPRTRRLTGSMSNKVKHTYRVDVPQIELALPYMNGVICRYLYPKSKQKLCQNVPQKNYAATHPTKVNSESEGS